jgi:squalene-hopene/tetraprenyl-beta-curcumene cyclase
MKNKILMTALAALGFVAAERNAFAAEPAATATTKVAADAKMKPLTAEQEAKRKKIVDAGIEYLLSKGQASDGSFGNKQAGTGITSIVLMGLLENGKAIDDPKVASALKSLVAAAEADGSFGKRIKNYETCLAVLALQTANKDGRFKEQIGKSDKFLRDIQLDDNEGKDKSDVSYGGVGYGKGGNADLSNTAFLVEALVAAGAGPDDPALKNALVFVSRCQNLESEHNTTPLAGKVNDGGFYYKVISEPNPNDDKSFNGGLRSYGSMSYAGFKSMVYAGLKEDDKRVKAALTFLKKNYDLKANPGLGEAGLYYYYHLMSKALSAAKMETFKDDKGVEHNWRAEFIDELASRQNADGSWTNKNRQWLESDPNLVTGYALLVLAYCK